MLWERICHDRRGRPRLHAVHRRQACRRFVRERIDVVCPSDGKAFASIPASGQADVDRAVEAARRAFEDGPWSRMPAVERGRCLTRLATGRTHGEELAALESRDTGKPIRQGKADVVATMRYYEFYGGAGDKIHGDTLPFLDGYTALTLARAAWRRRRHHSLELSAADHGAGRGRGACDGQHAGGQAGGGRFPVNDPHRGTGARSRFSARRVQCHHRLWPRSRRSAFRSSATSTMSPSPARRPPAPRSSKRRRSTIAASPWNSAASHRRSSSPTPISKRRCPVLVNAVIQNGGQTCSAGSRVLIERSVYERVASASPSASPIWSPARMMPTSIWAR